MASLAVKHYLRHIFNERFKYYRLFFNLVSVAFFSVIIFYQFSIDPVELFEVSTISKALGLLLFLAGLVAMFYAFKAFNTKEFIGVEQLKKSENDNENIQLTKSGFYGLVRHPLYFATILLIVGAFIFMPTVANAVFALVVFVYLPIGVYLEEQKLIKEFGESYIQYQKEVKAVIPFIFF